MSKRKLLHVGCGFKSKSNTTPFFISDDWEEVRFDIDSSVKPDVVGSMLDMKEIPDESVDAVFSSHNIEHLYPHEVLIAFSEFKRVLKKDGCLVINCPDLQEAAQLIADNKLTEVVYESSSGGIAPIDIVYGFRPALAQGNTFMAHKCGFTEKVLVQTLRSNGFSSVVSMRRLNGFFEIWAVAYVSHRTEQELLEASRNHFPRG